ncbi:hypothetical protein K1T71_011530 [Dendrolimus kikuchii]|uniref:Uncharacterized protein n=1 Tax=Dendrolimus kikuchii TaxID=765133 RepID=A0ACC1CP23_9NEOP|nr:hypothetical protein K1T71_011530 [Dendrolimus kikuchii]
MKTCVTVAVILMISRPCTSRSVVEPEESVVSVYTTLPTTQGTNSPLDVYHQIANNIAERITSPIYRFLGIDQNKTDAKLTKKPWDKIEILDEPEDVTKPDLPPVDNDITIPRDIEEISRGGSRKGPKKPEKLTLFSSADKKPERITLFSSYLPVENQESNETGIDDGFFDFDEGNDDAVTPREGAITLLLELISSLFQLVWGGFLTLLFPAPPDNTESESS